jgi:predicted Ser/Thr protein kinase
MQVEGTLKNEAEWLKRLNSMNIGPSLLHSDPLRVVTEFIQGVSTTLNLYPKP